MHAKGATQVGQGRSAQRKRGAILAMVLIVVMLVALMGNGLLALASQNALTTSRELNATKAFWLAEAGVQRFDKLCMTQRASIGETTLGSGSYRVEAHFSDATTSYADVIATVQGAEQRIRVRLAFLGRLYEHALFAGNEGGTNNYILDMRGVGNPVAYTWPNGDPGERGGKDIVNGKVYANGNVNLYGQSMVSNAPPPNTAGIAGDVEATGHIAITNAAQIFGLQTAHVSSIGLPIFPDYATIRTYDVSAEFASRGITAGYLPANHPLHNVVVKNPSNRAAECASTAGDDYFFEPRTISGSGTWKSGTTPLNLGNNQIYYVDGHVWFNNHSTYGFKISGTATIASTADIHVSDNLDYANTGSMLGLVALGHPDLFGNVLNGNVYFGDPEFGTLYSVDAFMFARHDFLYNTSSNTGQPGEPQSGYQVFGNYGALGEVKVNRDWYTRSGRARPAVYNTAQNQWQDALDLSYWITDATELASLRHYQMIINYDERIRNPATQPPGLPRLAVGNVLDPNAVLYAGIVKWDALPFEP